MGRASDTMTWVAATYAKLAGSAIVQWHEVLSHRLLSHLVLFTSVHVKRRMEVFARLTNRCQIRTHPRAGIAAPSHNSSILAFDQRSPKLHRRNPIAQRIRSQGGRASEAAATTDM